MEELSYFREIRTEKAVYSVDKLTVAFCLRDELICALSNDETALSEFCGLHLVDYYIRRNSDTYRYMGSYDEDVAISVKIVVNPQACENICYLDCNPNKCFNNQQCVSDITFLLKNSYECKIKSLDIAVDIPIGRNSVSVKKDKRVMIRFITSKSDKGTIYLGKKRHSVGRVKVYDKQKESELPNELTRVEFTLGNPLKSDWVDELKKKLPHIYILSPKENVCLDNHSLSSTDLVLIQSLNKCSDKINLFNLLDYKKKKKLESFVLYNEELFDFDDEIMHRVAISIVDYIRISGAVIE